MTPKSSTPLCQLSEHQGNKALAEFVFTLAMWLPALINNPWDIFFKRFYFSRIAGFKMEAKHSLHLVPVRTNVQEGSETLQTRGNAADVSPGGTGQEEHSCAVCCFTCFSIDELSKV